MNALAIIIELAEVAALIVLVIYLIRITRDKDDTEPRSSIIDRNLAELAGFHRILVGSPDLARIWQDGRADRRLNDIDQERFSLLANDYLTLLANQRQRADSIQDSALVEAATLKLIDTLLLNPGLLPEWEEIADKVASPSLRDAVTKAMNPPESEEETVTEPVAAVEEDEALAGEESSVAAVDPTTSTKATPKAEESAAADVNTVAPAGVAKEPAGGAEAGAGTRPVTESATPITPAKTSGPAAAKHTEATGTTSAGDDGVDAIPAKAS